MSNVTLSIGGRSYTVACAAGEEEHVAGLGRAIDAKIQSMGAAGTTESRQLLFAALLLADGQAERLESIAAKLEACALALEG